MTQYSRPVVEANLTRVDWASIMGTGDGIANDLNSTTSGNAFALTLSGDSATVGPGEYRIDGFVLTVATGTTEVFTLAPVGSPTTYSIGVLSTPANEATSLLTLVKDVAGGAAVTPVAGGAYRELHSVPRTASTPLSGASPRTDHRSWAGELVSCSSASALANIPSPRGSLALVGGQTFERALVGGSLTWVSLSDPPWLPVTPAGGIEPVTGRPSAVYRVVGGMVQVDGEQQRTARAPFIPTTTSPGYTVLGTLPVGARPVAVRTCAGIYGDANIRVSLETTGQLRLSAYPGTSAPNVLTAYLGGMAFRL